MAREHGCAFKSGHAHSARPETTCPNTSTSPNPSGWTTRLRPGLDQKVRFLAKSLGTRSLLVVPVVLGEDVLGLVGMHTTRTPRVWLDDEVSFLESIARQIAVGYEYTRLYTDKEREAETKRALLEIANALNARSDFREVSSLVLERAITLVGADYSALGVLDPKGGRITLAAFKAAPHATTDTRSGID